MRSVSRTAGQGSVPGAGVGAGTGADCPAVLVMVLLSQAVIISAASSQAAWRHN
jgi:hypothetical protein